MNSVISMPRVNRIIKHELFRANLKKLAELEKDRKFCRHNIEHFLDTARIMSIMSVEFGAEINKEVIYAAALLHDLGRVDQYTKGTPHEEASALIAEKILKDCVFSTEETFFITSAIRSHRNKQSEELSDLAFLLNKADKKSRLCLFCDAFAECNWSSEKKNSLIDY